MTTNNETHEATGTTAKEGGIQGSHVLEMVVNFFSLSIKSIAVGASIGLFCSLVLKYFDMTYDAVKETSVMMMFAYLSYLTAEQCSFSGIISMFSCGLFMSHYAFYNISPKA